MNGIIQYILHIIFTNTTSKTGIYFETLSKVSGEHIQHNCQFIKRTWNEILINEITVYSLIWNEILINGNCSTHIEYSTFVI